MDLGLYSEWTRFGRRLQQEMSCLNICGFLQSLQDSIRIVSQLDNHRILLNHFQFIVILPLDRTLFQRLTVPQIKKKIKPFPDMSVGDATLQLPLFLILTLDGGEWLSQSRARFVSGNEPPYPLNMSLGGKHGRSG